MRCFIQAQSTVSTPEISTAEYQNLEFTTPNQKTSCWLVTTKIDIDLVLTFLLEVGWETLESSLEEVKNSCLK